MAFYSNSELLALGFKSIGRNVKLSKLASIHGYESIEIGDNSRIDDFCIISAGSGGIVIGKHVHIACYALIIGKAKIEMHDFSGLSSRGSIYSSTDDFSGNYLTGPTIPVEFTNVISEPVEIGRHVVIGSNSTVLPGVSVGDGSAIGAHSLVNKSIPAKKIAFGVPAKVYSDRGTAIFDLEKKITGV